MVLEHCQQLLQTWLTGMGLTLNEAKSHISHTLDLTFKPMFKGVWSTAVNFETVVKTPGLSSSCMME